MEYLEVMKSVAGSMAKIQIAKAKIEDLHKEETKVQEKMILLDNCQQLAQIVAQGVQQRAHSMIAKVVSTCLQVVFDEPYSFEIQFDRKRGRTEAKLLFERDGMEIDPLLASGGGVIDVAAFALRLAAIALRKPHSRKIAILDEPFRFVSSGYQEKIRDMLIMMCKEYGFQFVFVTHIERLVTGKTIELN